MEGDGRFAGFRIERELGRGGMGVVYLAEHVHLGRRVALKFLGPGLSESADFRERFVRESRLAAALHHPNIVTVYDAGEAEGRLYIAMQYVDGTDLATLLATEGALGPSRAAEIVQQVGAALDAAHAEGLVHRDVKPANVLLRDGHAYLTDFGLTKRTTAATSLTQTGQFVGTAQYMAPEQILGEAVDGRADVYALGCILFHCLTGGPPFERDNSVAVIYAHLNDPPPTATAVRPELPAAIDEVIARAMAKSPDERYATGAALAAEARVALEADGAPAEVARAESAAPRGEAAAPPRAEGPAPSPPRPRRRIAAIAAAVCAAVLVAVGVVVFAAGDDGGDGDGARDAAPATADIAPLRDNNPPEPAGELAVGNRPSDLALDADHYSVWVSNLADSTVTRVDTGASNVLEDPLPVGDAPSAVVVANGYVWVANRDSDSLTRIKAARRASPGRSFDVGPGPTDLAVTLDTVWVVNGADDTVQRLDAEGQPLGSTAKVGRGPHRIAADAAGAWVTNGEDGTVSRLDGDGRGDGEPIRVGRDPAGLVLSDGVAWVTNRADGTVSRIDVATGRTIGAPIRVGRAPTGITAANGVIWVTNTADGSVVKLDPKTGARIGDPIPAGTEPVAIVMDEYSAWVADATGNVVQLAL